jgi:hypothetical protein
METKKTLLLVVAAMLVAMGLRAQYADMYYHRVGDTIEWRAPNGYYTWWDFEHFYQNNIPISTKYTDRWCDKLNDSSIMLQRFFTPVPLKIIVVAGSPYIYRYGNPGSVPDQGQIPDSTAYQDYFLFYDATPTGLVLLKEVPWSLSNPFRILHIRNHTNHAFDGSDSCCNYNPTQEYVPIWEYYFDTALYLTDSFYVGGSMNNNFDVTNPDWSQGFPGYRFASYIPLSNPCEPELIAPDCHPLGNTVVHKQKNCGSPSWSPWQRYPQNHSQSVPALIYPIIEVDTTVPSEGSCIPLSNIEVSLVDSGCAVVTWDDFPNYNRIILQYGSAAVPPNHWTTIEIADNSFCRICEFNNAGRYGVRLKAVCNKTETSWSQPLFFYSSGNIDPQTPVPTILSANTFLSPNPATGTVVVSSSFAMKNIDIYSAHGILVFSTHPDCHRQEISLTGLPAGTYLVVIDTFAGSTNKKLVIE